MTKQIKDLPVRVAVFDRVERAERIVQQLIDSGFSKEQITVVHPNVEPEEVEGVKTKEPAGAHAPAAAIGGGAIGALLGGIAATATIAATGGLSLVVIGPALLGAGGGAVTGGLVGAMMSRGFDDEIANYYDQALQKGKVLVSVEDKGPNARERLASAEEIFERAGAEPVPLREG